MARKRKRHSRRKSAVAASASPVRRRKRYAFSAPRRRKRKRGLSEFSLVKGKAGKYANPLLKGAMGGFSAQGTLSMIPESLFTDNANLSKNRDLIEVGLLGLAAVVAAHFDEPLVAAGCAGGAAVIYMKKKNILQDNAHGGFSGRRMGRGRFADPNLLSRGMADAALLSEGVYNIYPPYDPLYESASAEFKL